jgi:peptidyl-prolyl cis-trans isomerase SurA
LTNSLVQGGVSINTLKAKIRADIAWSQLVRGRYSSSLQVGEADINKAILSRGAQTDDVGYNYTLYPITIILSANATQATLTTARQTADNLRNRFQNCKDGLRLARALRDVAVREPITRNSADLVPQLRELLSGLELGRLTPAESTPQGLQMFALCDKKETNADSAAKREIRDELFSKRFEAQGKKFLNEVRRSAMIEYR